MRRRTGSQLVARVPAIALALALTSWSSVSAQAAPTQDPPSATAAAPPPAPATDAAAAPRLDPAEMAELYGTIGEPPAHEPVLRRDLAPYQRMQRGRALRRLGILGLLFTPATVFMGMIVVPSRTDSPAAFVTGATVVPVGLGAGSLWAVRRGNRLVRSGRPSPR